MTIMGNELGRYEKRFQYNFAGRFGLSGMGIVEVVGVVEVASMVGPRSD